MIKENKKRCDRDLYEEQGLGDFREEQGTDIRTELR